MNTRISFISFGQFAGTHFYYHLAKRFRSLEYDVEMATDRRTITRLDTRTNTNQLPVREVALSISSLRNYVQSKVEQDTFILFGNVLFALPCVDLLRPNRYAIQSTLFLRPYFATALSNLLGLDKNQILAALTTLPMESMVDITPDLKVILQYLAFPGYSFLYSMYDELSSDEPATGEHLDIDRGDLYKVICTLPALLPTEKALFANARMNYSYYREPHKMDFLFAYYPELRHKLSHLVPCVEVPPVESVANEQVIYRKMESKTVLFFCGEREFSHWNGELALQVFSALPDDFRFVVLGEIPERYVDAAPQSLLQRLQYGIVDQYEKVREIHENASVLLAINRQLVSYSVLESMTYGTPAIFSDKITSFGHGVLDRRGEEKVGAYVKEDTAQGYANAILGLLNDKTVYKECVARQMAFVRHHFDITEIVERLVTEFNI